MSGTRRVLALGEEPSIPRAAHFASLSWCVVLRVFMAAMGAVC